jgi:hypothetical protein
MADSEPADQDTILVSRDVLAAALGGVIDPEGLIVKDWAELADAVFRRLGGAF